MSEDILLSLLKEAREHLIFEWSQKMETSKHNSYLSLEKYRSLQKVEEPIPLEFIPAPTAEEILSFASKLKTFLNT